MAAWQGFVRYDICNRNRQLLVYYLHELVCDVRDSHRHRGDRCARSDPDRDLERTHSHTRARLTFASPLSRATARPRAEAPGPRPRGARAAHGRTPVAPGPRARDTPRCAMPMVRFIYLHAHVATSHRLRHHLEQLHTWARGAHHLSTLYHYAHTRDGHDYVRVRTAMPKGSSQSSSKCAHASRPLSTDTAAPARHGRAAC